MGQEKATEERDQICLVHRTENCQCFKSIAINKTRDLLILHSSTDNEISSNWLSWQQRSVTQKLTVIIRNY